VTPVRALGIIALLALLSAAQTPPSPALKSGVLLERDTLAPEGEFSIRADSNEVFRYRYDGHTYAVRDGQLVTVPALNPGERVEVISDDVAGSLLRYARDVHVISETPMPRARPAPPSRLTGGVDPLDRYLFPLSAGDLTFAGVVYRVTGERVVLHTRGGDQLILLRHDTRYIQDGASVDSASLKPNMRVFIRGGKDIWDQVEAYQVSWGQILQPR
jgi:hypothetical protein